MLDPFDREIYYLRISVTDRCNLRCRYCVPDGSCAGDGGRKLLSFEEIETICRTAAGLGFTKVRLTGGEPLLRKGIERLTAMIAAVEGIDFVGLTTNGILLPRLARPLAKAGLTGVNISLDTLDPERYRSITAGGEIGLALAGIDAAVETGFEKIKINMVVDADTSSAEISEMERFCEGKGVILQLIEAYELSETKKTVSAFNRPPRCSDCNRLRLTADGMLKPCLHSDIEIPVDFRGVEESIRKAVMSKLPEGQRCTNRGMMRIGG